MKYNIDQLLFLEGQIVAFGWGFSIGNSTTHVNRLTMHLDFAEGLPLEIDAEYGQQRDDVKAAFPSVPEAENSGFLLLASIGQRKVARAVLRWELADATITETPVHLPQGEEQQKPGQALAHYQTLAKKAFSLFRSAGLGPLLRKVRRYLSSRPQVADQDKWSSLRTELGGKLLAIVVDHDMGGGANIYRNQHVAERRAQGETVLLMGFHVASLQYFIEVIDENAPRRYVIGSPEMLMSLALCGKVQHMMYNCAVSFRQPLDAIATLIALKQQTGACLLVTVHDYFVICPSHFLLDSESRFCGVPEKSRCEKCLPSHRDGFVSFSGVRDIGMWRDKWAALLSAANEVRMFSESSWKLLKRAYPLLADANWRVVPHVLHTQPAEASIPAGTYLHIGIVGAIGKHKGAEIVRELAVEIARRNADTRITIIGTLDAKVSRKIVSVTGAYQPTRLSEIIRESGANVFLFPSIWGETFSYVSHELVAMGVPFSCFDLGAPADLARRYAKGLVLDSMDAGAILDQLEQFRHQIYQLENAVT